MNTWKISIKNLKSKLLYSILSVVMLSLSIALLLGIQQLKTSFEYQMDNNLGDIDLVVGAKGSPLQLVLSSVLHIDNPTGNIPYIEVSKFKKNRMIKKAVPISYGDNYKGYKIIGTTSEFIKIYNAELLEGGFFDKSMQVVLGYNMAKQLRLNIGDKFLSSHGLVENNIEIHNDEFVVVGILKSTQKVIDNLIVTNLESIWKVHDHGGEHYSHIIDEHSDHEDHDHENHEEHLQEHEDKQVTSVLITFRNPTALLTFPRRINEGTNMQAALPKYELSKLYEYTGVGFNTISWIAYIILVISGLTIFISLYKMVKERAFELALLRTYGASNFQLIKMVSYEGLLILGLAFIIAFLFATLGLHFMFNFVDGGWQKNILQPLPLNELLRTIGLVFVMIILSIGLAIYPIIKMNISTILSNEK